MKKIFLILIIISYNLYSQDKVEYEFKWVIKDSISYKTKVKVQDLIPEENKNILSESEFITLIKPHKNNLLDLITTELKNDGVITNERYVGRMNSKGEMLLMNHNYEMDFFPKLFELPKQKISISQKWELKKEAEKIRILPDSTSSINEVTFEKTIQYKNQKIAVFNYNVEIYNEYVVDEVSKVSDRYLLNGYSYFSIDSGIYIESEFKIEFKFKGVDLIEDKESELSKIINLQTKLSD